MWRGAVRYFSRKSVSSPNEAAASRPAASMASSSSDGSATTRIPLPPPPAEALTSTGNPSDMAALPTAVRPASSTEGSVGTPAASMRRFDSSLEPIVSIASGEGPTQVIPEAITARAKLAFSARNP